MLKFVEIEGRNYLFYDFPAYKVSSLNGYKTIQFDLIPLNDTSAVRFNTPRFIYVLNSTFTNW